MSLISAVMRNSFKNIASPCLSSYVQVFIPLRKYCIQENKSEAKPPKKKTSPIPKITLISGSSISVTTLDEAQKISKRRDLKLVKIIDLDTKTQRPIYKLMTGSEYHQEDLKQREENKKQKNSNFIKGEKILLLNDTISDHDLEVQGKKF
ncbi:hypothetical protein HHI36_010729 [Cryptolaemus montrouzieri]|uniref:Translation initiation factor 3 N-terminal domain-containing protein n=1 Tax=Cryptolaemus montrouzieri TaxID=559131 RepID=A0ABD2MJN3_9CUCU